MFFILAGLLWLLSLQEHRAFWWPKPITEMSAMKYGETLTLVSWEHTHTCLLLRSLLPKGFNISKIVPQKECLVFLYNRKLLISVSTAVRVLIASLHPPWRCSFSPLRLFLMWSFIWTCSVCKIIESIEECKTFFGYCVIVSTVSK